MTRNKNPQTPKFMSDLLTVGAFFVGLIIGGSVATAVNDKKLTVNLDDLHTRLDEAVKREDYYEAARLRDLIAATSKASI